MPDELLLLLIFACIWFTLYFPILWHIRKLRCELYRDILTLFSDCEENMFKALLDLQEDSQQCHPQQD